MTPRPIRPSFPVDRRSAAELLGSTEHTYPAHGSIEEDSSNASGESALDRTLEKLGVGAYQRKLLCVLLSGSWYPGLMRQGQRVVWMFVLAISSCISANTVAHEQSDGSLIT